MILLFLVSFSCLGDMVFSLIHDDDMNKGQLCLHTNKPLLCQNDPGSRSCCLQLTAGARRIKRSTPTFAEEVAVAQRG